MDLTRALDPAPIAAVAGALVAGAWYGWRVGRRDGSSPLRATEAALLGAVMAFTSCTFIGAVLAAGNDSRGTGLLVGWLFFLLPGAVDTLVYPFGMSLLTSPGVLLALALAVGGFTGVMHGAHRVYQWRRLGALWALLDATWALTGATLGALAHVVDLLSGERGAEERTDAVRFAKGFHPPGKPRYAITLGPVMSNLDDEPGTALHQHERVHVFQARVFGPVHVISYLGWMALTVVPALVVGATRRAPASRVEPWCYFSNPWEVWGYGKQRKCRAEPADACSRTRLSRDLCLSEPVATALGLPFVVLVAGVMAALAAAVLG